MNEDDRLLGEYCRNGSESAFRELVDRHLKLVYSAAMRIVNGDAHLAQDISQLVFSKLARKAPSLPAGVVLAGWLHRDTRFTSLAVLRKERRRIEREQEVVKMHELEMAGQEMEWTALRPMLDEILDELSDEDRHALLLRFFDQRSLAEVGAATGLAEDAARKRVVRSLDKLRAMLASRGITTTVAALTMLLTVHGGESVPTGLSGTLSQAAVAGVGGTTGSTLAVLSFFTSTKIVMLAGVLLVGGVVATLLKSSSHRAPESPPAVSTVQDNTNSTAARSTAPTDTLAEAITPTWLTAALRNVEEALHDPTATTNFPNSIMAAAIDQLGAQKKAANPMLVAALTNADPMVRMRAVDGLGMVGAEAKEAAPILLGLLRSGDVGGDIRWTMYKIGLGALIGIEPENLILYSLGEIGAAPEILPDLAQIVQENAAARRTILRSAGAFTSDRQSMLGAKWLLACADANSTALNEAFSPLLRDGNPEVRRTAASCLANALGTNADVGVFPVAIELLRSGDDSTLRLDGLTMLTQALEGQSRVMAGGKSDRPGLDATRIGEGLSEIVAALTEVAVNTKREDLRYQAWILLDDLNPDFRHNNPQIAAAMEQKEQLAAFRFKVRLGQATMVEMLEGLKQFPNAAPEVAETLANGRSDAHEALPALKEAMSSLAPLPAVSGSDRAAAIRAREQLANAMQKIAPELPKTLFTDQDVRSIMGILTDPAVRADANRRNRISSACKVAEWPFSGPCDVSPEQVRRLLAALKEADGVIYEAVAAKVKEIDPLFR